MLPTDLPGLLAFWDFQEASGPFVSRGGCRYSLQERDGAVERVSEGGVFGPRAVRLGGGPWMTAPRAEAPRLDIHGAGARVSVVAWVRREPAATPGCQAVAGVWNEHGKRQYCLFLNLRIHDSAEQVGAHVSRIGGPTRGFKYCMDAAIGAVAVPMGEWRCVGMTYDGEHARAYLDGRLDARGDRNPYAYPGGLFDGGPEGADFTVGAVARPERVDDQRVEHGAVIDNRFYGLLGGLAVYERALSDAEMVGLASLA